MNGGKKGKFETTVVDNVTIKYFLCLLNACKKLPKSLKWAFRFDVSKGLGNRQLQVVYINHVSFLKFGIYSFRTKERNV